MCGIVGILGTNACIDHVMSGMQRLEYRGYDSSGMATLIEGGIHIIRAVGDFCELKKIVPAEWGAARVGIGHTRWATHGRPSVDNAHPQSSHRVTLVHNGIIENAADIHSFLKDKGYTFSSQTDTESIVHLLDWHYGQTGSIRQSMISLLKDLKGSFAIACLLKGCVDSLVVARRGTPPLLIGYNQECVAISSDALGLPHSTKEISYMPSGSWAVINDQVGVCVYDEQGHSLFLKRQENKTLYSACERNAFPHFMLKEIHEQPTIIEHLMANSVPTLDVLQRDEHCRHVTLLGCGTSFYAAWAGKYFLEEKVPVSLELASEFHYRRPPMLSGLSLALSQSGETADTLKAMAYAKEKGQNLACIVNAPHSSLARMSQSVFSMHAGLEIGVASTKSFTAQLWILLAMSGVRVQDCQDLPALLEKTIALSEEIKDVARLLQHSISILYVGRGGYYPIALEGALKMKELSYIHAEGLAAGELKHGTIALIDDTMPVVVVAPHDNLFDKTLSTLYEIDARKGRLIVITDPKGQAQLKGTGMEYQSIMLPDCQHAHLKPFVSVVALQLLAYHTAFLRGCSIDKPRNLAKSVTVE